MVSLQARRDGRFSSPHEKLLLVETSELLLLPIDSNILLFRADHKAAAGGRDANAPGVGEGEAQRAFAKGFIVLPVAFYQQILCNRLSWASECESPSSHLFCKGSKG